ncbi:hypothetical protein GOV04_03885 [Candidatus Woesearchaeota archaeon]|nr:hypothetical protein [Candidatus Woesearchaeota archaeon]
MKNELSSLDIYYLVKELQSLKNAKINKIYQEKDLFYFQLHITGKPKTFLKVQFPSIVYLSEYKPNFEQPSGFCMFLRKHLTNARIQKIEQVDFERIIKIVVETKNEPLTLVLELFAPGNLLLLKNEKIFSAYQLKKWKDRTVRPNIDYIHPKLAHNTLELDEKNFQKIIVSSDKDSIVKTLAIDLALGGLYAEELCDRAKIDKTTKKSTPAQIKKLFLELQKLLKEKLKPRKTEKTISPISLKSQKLVSSYETFSQALDENITVKELTKKAEQTQKNQNQKLTKAKQVLERQQKRIVELEKQAVIEEKKANKLYEEYQKIKEILALIQKNIKTPKWEELKKQLQSKNVKINEKTKELNFKLR